MVRRLALYLGLIRRDDADDLTDIVLGLLKADRDWIRTRHVWWHPAGLSIWVANEAHGLAVRLEARGLRDWYTRYTVPPDAIHLSGSQRRRVWRAVRGRRTHTGSADALKKTAHNVLAMYATATLTPPPCGLAPASSEGDRE